MRKYSSVDEMKEAYKEMDVPGELKEQVNASITRAELTVKRRMRIKTAAWRTLALSAVGVLAFVILVNANANVAMAMEGIPFLGKVVKVVRFYEYRDVRENGRVQAEIRTPEIEMEGSGHETSDEMNQKIREYTDAVIAQYEEEVRRIEGSSSEGEDVYAAYNVLHDYEIVTNNDKLFSIRINTDVVMAGSNSYIKIYHIDKTSKKMITLKDLFWEDADYVTIISEVIKREMRRQMEADSNVCYWLDDEIEEWNFKQISSGANFYINQAGKLTIVFDKYEVAPGSMGVVEFTIPTEDLADIVKDGYLQ